MSLLIETERLLLDEFAPDRDELFIFQLLNEPGYLDNIGDRDITNLDAARVYIQAVPLKSYADHGHGLWRVRDKATDEVIGMCGLIRRDGLEFPDIGYAFLEIAWGRGYATEAAAASLDYGRRVLGLPQIVGITALDNAASVRVLEKIGFKFDRIITLPGRDDESRLFVG